MSNGSIATVPPAALARSVASSALSTAMYVFHIAGALAAASSGDCGAIADTTPSPSFAMEYTASGPIGMSS